MFTPASGVCNYPGPHVWLVLFYCGFEIVYNFIFELVCINENERVSEVYALDPHEVLPPSVFQGQSSATCFPTQQLLLHSIPAGGFGTGKAGQGSWDRVMDTHEGLHAPTSIFMYTRNLTLNGK